MQREILLFLPSYFTPWTPPLGISILKAYLEQRGHKVRCMDLNTHPQLWGMHHRYFARLRELEGVSINDGYSKLWYILNAHLLAFVNGASSSTCRKILRAVAPLYAIQVTEPVLDDLVPIVERYFDDLRETVDGIDLSRFSIVGTSTYTTSLASSLFVLREVKRRRPEILTVMGGGIFADDLALGSDNLDTLLAEHPYVDHVVLGEGELLFEKLVEGELAHKRVISIADVDGRTLEINQVPVPDFSDFDLDSYYHLTIEGGRSCPFQCSFCSETTQWGTYRVKSRELLANQLNTLAKRFGNNTFFMGDSLMDPYILGLSRELIERGVHVLYDGYLRADKAATDRGRTRNWADSGVYRVRLGIESASADVLASMVKMTTPETISRALKALANAGIRTTTYWIVGYPGETEHNFQETLDFIRDHHRFIYELEAHPYYYYPYGQVGSRLHQCFSLYPSEVTDVIKFKIWEIVDAQPTREEKYQRLRRISALASALGLPNIYTMSDRYYAEERWQQLHPLTREIYASTHVHRHSAALPAQPVPMPALVGDQPVVAWARIEEELAPSLLAAALDGLAKHNEMLWLDCRDGACFATEGLSLGERALRVLDMDPAEGALDTVAEALARELGPAAGDSLRLAVVGSGPGPRAMVLAVHPAVTDPRGLTFLFEDLFRLYRQLASGRRITLRPVSRTWTDLVAEWPAGSALRAALYDGLSVPARIRDIDAAEPEEGIEILREGGRETRLRLRERLLRRLFSHALAEARLRPVEVLAAALLDALTGSGRQVILDATVDLRSLDSRLDRTVGPFAAVGRLTKASSPGEIRARLREIELLTSEEVARPGESRVLLRTEWLVEEPWLEGDLWNARGFLQPAGSPPGSYALEIVPVLSAGTIELLLRGGRGKPPLDLLEELPARLENALDAILLRCERRLAALCHCRSELASLGPVSNLGELIGQHRGTGAWKELRVDLDSGPVDLLCERAGTGSGDVLRAAFGALLSRLSGREEVLLLVADGVGVAPLRLRAFWNLSFSELLEQTAGLSRAVFPLGSEMLEVLEGESPEGGFWPRFDVGLGCFETSAAESVRTALAVGSRLGEGLDLCLDLTRRNGRLRGLLTYRSGGALDSLAEGAAATLGVLLESVARSPVTALGEISFGEPGGATSRTSSLSDEVFEF